MAILENLPSAEKILILTAIVAFVIFFAPKILAAAATISPAILAAAARFSQLAKVAQQFAGKSHLILNNSILKICNSPHLQKIVGFANGLAIPDFLGTQNSRIGFLVAKIFEKSLSAIFEKMEK